MSMQQVTKMNAGIWIIFLIVIIEIVRMQEMISWSFYFSLYSGWEQDEATSLYICDEHGYGTNAMHNGTFSIVLFVSFWRRRQQQ